MNGYITYHRKQYRFIDKANVYINRNTPVGEPADYYERMAWDGRRKFDPVFSVKNSVCDYAYHREYNFESKRWQVKILPELKEYLDKKRIQLPEVITNNTLIIINE